MSGSPGTRRWLVWSILLMAATFVSCDSGEEAPTTAVQESLAAGALDAVQGMVEVPLREVPPDPPDELFAWERAYRVGTLPAVNVGRAKPEFLRAAGRAIDETLVCLGADGSAGCGSMGADEPRPNLTGLNFGGPDVRAWAWAGVPRETVAVVFTDQTGLKTWQRPIGRVAMFPDTIGGNADGDCPCRLDAIDGDGDVIVAVDLRSGEYISG